MPGISFVYEKDRNIIESEPLILSSLDSILHNEQYKREILLSNRSYILGCTRYADYPLMSFENDEFCIYLEGRMYGKDHPLIERELSILAEIASHVGKEQITEWLLNTDGDFIIFILHKKHDKISIINDALGRLPLYYYKSKERLIISRELGFITNLMDVKEFDRMAIAQCLLFSYPLGKRTLLENVYRLEPATLISIDTGKAEIEIHTLHRFDFESKRYNNKSIEENTSELVSLFCEGCKNRISQKGKNVVSLSGGLDSRSVAAGLRSIGIPFSSATYLNYNEATSRDVEIAMQLANILGIDWKAFRLDPPKGKDVLNLLRIKSGLNYLGMSFILLFLSDVRETYGSEISFFTGDGGDKLLPDPRPFRKLKTLDDLEHYIIFANQIFPPQDVATLTRIRKQEIVDELRDHVLTYPEKDPNQKYVHFIFYERGIKWLFEGEDRNRFYFWSVAPFYSIKLFDCAMNCPDEQKARHKLYRNFLLKLSPQVCALDNADWGFPVTSRRVMIKENSTYILLRRLLGPKLRRVIKSPSQEHNSNLINCLRDQIINCKPLSDYLSRSAMDNILDNLRNYNRVQIENLFTISSLIEELECTESNIKEYYDFDFI